MLEHVKFPHKENARSWHVKTREGESLLQVEEEVVLLLVVPARFELLWPRRALGTVVVTMVMFVVFAQAVGSKGNRGRGSRLQLHPWMQINDQRQEQPTTCMLESCIDGKRVSWQ